MVADVLGAPPFNKQRDLSSNNADMRAPVIFSVFKFCSSVPHLQTMKPSKWCCRRVKHSHTFSESRNVKQKKNKGRAQSPDMHRHVQRKASYANNLLESVAQGEYAATRGLKYFRPLSSCTHATEMMVAPTLQAGGSHCRFCATAWARHAMVSHSAGSCALSKTMPPQVCRSLEESKSPPKRG